MMTQELGISILAAPLAAIDRRALSQAWYSALHCAHEVDGRQAASRPARTTAALHPRARLLSEAAPGAQRRVTIVAARTASSARPLAEKQAAPKNISRASRALLARRIAAALAAPRATPGRATFSIGRGGARVHVIFQTNGDRVTVLAICRPEVRAFVARALAYVCVALRARGVPVHFEAKETTCS